MVSKQGKRVRASRPIQKLIPFEVTEANKDSDFNYVDVVERYPRRQAAVDGGIRLYLDTLSLYFIVDKSTKGGCRICFF